ncbi:MAG: hypothetical protein ACSHXH_08725 [Marivita sp.]|uniref:hypothetical protein n=1 Tax=Marivita sp. TaxID=2003365 RepID=UPI003EF796AA
MFHYLRIAAVAICLPTLSAAQTTTTDVPVTGDFGTFEVGWAHGAGKLFGTWGVYDFSGRIAVCGAVRHSSNTVSRQNDEILRRGWIKHNGKKVLKDLRYFNDIGFVASFNGARATCKVTPVPSSAGGVQLGFDPGRARF